MKEPCLTILGFTSTLSFIPPRQSRSILPSESLQQVSLRKYNFQSSYEDDYEETELALVAWSEIKKELILV